jgi:uncharacterized protein (DUF4213/DUF364 family)
MGVIKAITEHMSHTTRDYTLKRVQVGFTYSAVQLHNQAIGVAFTFPKGEHCRPEMLHGKKPIAGRKAWEIIPYLGDENLISSSLALATVNALLSARELPRDVKFGDILDNLDIRKGDQVCMVGCFLPIVAALKKRKVKVVSVDEVPKPYAKPPEEVENLLPQSQIAIITATSIINNTIDHLLDLAASCREVALLGPSTPLLPEAFSQTKVSCLSGIRISEPEKVLQIIGEGGGFRDFKYYTRKVNLRLRKN